MRGDRTPHPILQGSDWSPGPTAREPMLAPADQSLYIPSERLCNQGIGPN